MAVLVKLTAVAPDHGYNLAVAALFALTAAAVFTIGATLWGAARGERGAVRAGLLAVALVLVAGNLEGARLLVADGGPLREYDWFAASRVVEDTINEFPWFSFLLGDLHAHVLALPFTLLALAFALQVVLAGPRLAPRGRALLEGGAAALAVGFLYAVNSWSYPVMAGLLALAVVAWLRDPRSEPARPAAARWLLLVLAGSALLVLPFHLSFDPSARGIGVVEEGRGFAGWLRDELLLFGSLAGFVAFAYVGRLLATRRPGRNAAWIAVAAVFAGSLLAALDYAHVALLAVLLLVALGALLSPRVAAPARIVWLLVAGGVACLLGPELLYVRDEFDDGPLYRMNTVFKLGYQAWLLLGLAAIGALAWRREWLARRRLRWTLGPGRGAARGRGARLSGRRHVRAQGRVRPCDRRSTGSAGCATARPATSARSSGSTTRRRGPGWCSSPSGTTTRPSATRASRRSPGSRPCWAGPGTSCSGAIASGRAGRTSRACTSRRRRLGRRSCCAATRCAGSWSATSSGRSTATLGSRSGTSSGSACTSAMGRRSGDSDPDAEAQGEVSGEFESGAKQMDACRSGARSSRNRSENRRVDPGDRRRRRKALPFPPRI